MQGFKTLEKTNVQVNANDVLRRHPRARCGRDHGGSERHGPRERAAGGGRRAVGRAGRARAMHEHRHQRRNMFKLRHPGAGRGSGRTSGADGRSGELLHRNGQRPNSNNMTIDGVANIDTGDNGGNMARPTSTRSRSSSSSRTPTRPSTAAPWAGSSRWSPRAAPSPSRLGLLVRRRGSWNANSWTNNRNNVGENTAALARNEYGYTIGGPIYITGRLQQGQEEALLLLEPGVPAEDRPGHRSG